MQLAKRPTRETYELETFLQKLGTPRTTGYRLAKLDALPVKAIRVGRRYLYPKNQVDALFATADDPNHSRAA